MSVFREAVSRAKRDVIEQALRDVDGNRRRAAAVLGISRAHLHMQIKTLGIAIPPPARRRRTTMVQTRKGRAMVRASVDGFLAMSMMASPGFAQGDGASRNPPFPRGVADDAESRDGPPVVAGFVHNAAGQVAGEVVLLVEALDGTGRVLARRYEQVPSTIPPFGAR
jgi:hypothetical protein